MVVGLVLLLDLVCVWISWFTSSLEAETIGEGDGEKERAVSSLRRLVCIQLCVTCTWIFKLAIVDAVLRKVYKEKDS